MQQFNYQSAQFITSAAQMSQCPIDEGAEVAFCGRSNAGKSSAINTLTRQKKLARTSKTPGRTQLINFFGITDTARLVDLPGYGYAKVPLTLKQYWQTHLDTYFRSRQSLKGVILLTDIRHALKPFDEMMLEWSHTAGLPIHVLLTKADKLARGAQQNALLKVNANLPKHAKAQTFSAPNGQGLETLKSVLDNWLSIDP
ncbi:ribosome biogenesis GTP-binding protein YihA/YsxC [Pseudomonadales bacterium]|nr:ribosome biogenesis GTP-binding protein YihA/YsxC [Pseudomonadales bacterium]